MVTLPTALSPPRPAPTGTEDPLHVPTRSAGRVDGRTSDSVDLATLWVPWCVAHPASASNAMLATKTIPRLPMSILLFRKRLRWRFLKGEQGHNADQRRSERGTISHARCSAPRVATSQGRVVRIRSRTPPFRADCD